tara:strand:+ start:547 stop:744 length:198 start_codon:yes stop_codon:yes gene_type:complete
MKNNLKNILIFIGLIIALVFVSKKYSDYNLKKSISACILYQTKKTSKLNKEDAFEYCKKEINKSK